MIANRIRSKSNVPEGGFQPGDFSFDDIISYDGGVGNSQISPKTGNLYISAIPIVHDGTSIFNCSKNPPGTIEFTFYFDFDSPPFETTLSVTKGDEIYFDLQRTVPFPFNIYDHFTIELRNENSTGVLVDSFIINNQI